ncbi:MAG: septum formation inhibitor Maf [Syntrophobacteraceae bacterium]|nr:septum formation inhibitor Maf [Syntrophobacteraceae bacterium]
MPREFSTSEEQGLESKRPAESRSTGVFRTIQPLVLASSSPRRRQLLRSVGLDFSVHPSCCDELLEPGEDPGSLVRAWAARKARVISLLHPSSWILGADTIVLLDDVLFGKPGDPREAAAMLRRLSRRKHQVVSAVCLLCRERRQFHIRTVRTQVWFKKLDEEEIRAYVETGEPMDKAGAYGIQGAGAFLVCSIRGSYTNVVGLPLCETLELLARQKVIAPAG